MKVVIDHDLGEFYVWAMLDDNDFNGSPRDRNEAFVIGTGATKEEAVINAIRDLERALEQADNLR